MPIHEYDTAADWDAAYGPTPPRTPDTLSVRMEEWLQPDDSWGDIATRKGPPYISRRRPISFSEDPLLWQINYYGRAETPEYWYERRNKILTIHAIPKGDRILIVGAGTGALVKAFKDDAYTAVFGLEPSSFIQNNSLHMWGDVVVVDSDITQGNQLLARLRQGTGDDVFDWIIDEEMMLGYTDAELETVETGAYRFLDLPEILLDDGVPQSRIIHLVRTSGDPAFINIHTLAEWQAMDPAHSWMEI